VGVLNQARLASSKIRHIDIPFVSITNDRMLNTAQKTDILFSGNRKMAVA